MKSEEEIQKMFNALVTLEDAPEWLIDSVDLGIAQKTLTWVLCD